MPQLKSLTDQQRNTLPVVNMPGYGSFVVEGNAQVFTIPDDYSYALIECIEGGAYINGGTTADPAALPGTFPPATDVVDGSVPFMRVAAGTPFAAREFAIFPGLKFQVVPDDSSSKIAVYLS